MTKARYKEAKRGVRCNCKFRSIDGQYHYPKLRQCPCCSVDTIYKTSGEYWSAVNRFKSKTNDCIHNPKPVVEKPSMIRVKQWKGHTFVPFIDLPLTCERCGEERRFKSKDSFRLAKKVKHCRGCASELKDIKNNFKLNYNKEACKLMNKLNKAGYKFQHAENGGEVRVKCWSLDGYDKKNNIILEFMDRSHWRTEEDRRRHDYRINKIADLTDARIFEIYPATSDVVRVN